MSDINVEDLISIAENGEDDSSPSSNEHKSKYHDSILRFIKEYGIKSGKVRIPVYRLIYAYYVEFYGHQYYKASKIEFGRLFSKYFETSRSGAYRYYLLEPFCDMSKETMKKAKEYYRRYHLSKDRKSGKKIKKKQDKVQKH